jgi:histidyl-tRNA synthetase
MAKIEPRIFKGTRDFLPDEMIHREEIQKVMRAVFQKYGFEPIETPAIEYLEVLSGKYGDEADRLIYRLDYKAGTRDQAALHYDLTVPFSRVIAMNKAILSFPFKRYQIQPVWRADNPQPRQGRFREFYQCDVDAVGSKSMLVDAEIISIVNEVLTKLGFKGFLIKINNRKVLNGIVECIGLDNNWMVDICRAIDKLDKITFDEASKELIEKKIPAASLENLKSLIEENKISEDKIGLLRNLFSNSKIGQEGLDETETLLGYLGSMNIPSQNIRFDFTLARGLDYYTGPIFETTLPEHPHIGSLTGGGRYDELIGMFSGVNMPATGTSLGLDRILSAMQQLNMLPRAQTRTEVLLTVFSNDTMLESLRVASLLRNNNINCEIYHEPVKLKLQLGYANKKGIPFIIILGEDEIKAKKVTIKKLDTSEQTELDESELLNYLLPHLRKKN